MLRHPACRVPLSRRHPAARSGGLIILEGSEPAGNTIKAPCFGSEASSAPTALRPSAPVILRNASVLRQNWTGVHDFCTTLAQLRDQQMSARDYAPRLDVCVGGLESTRL